MKVLIIVDAQNDFINGSLGSIAATEAVERLCGWIRKNITENDKAIFTRDTHIDDYFDTQEGKNLPVSHCIRGSEGWKMNQTLEDEVKKTGCIVSYVNKNAFGTTGLTDYLPLFIGATDEIIFAGLLTDICVISNALILKAQEPEIPIKILADCCAGSTPEKHEAALSVMESCQIEIIRED